MTHLARLLVGVRHQATDKVGLTVVLNKSVVIYVCISVLTMNADVNEGHQGGHQLDEGDEVDRGDSLAATFLLLLALLLWCSCGLAFEQELPLLINKMDRSMNYREKILNLYLDGLPREERAEHRSN